MKENIDLDYSSITKNKEELLNYLESGQVGLRSDKYVIVEKEIRDLLVTALNNFYNTKEKGIMKKDLKKAIIDKMKSPDCVLSRIKWGNGWRYEINSMIIYKDSVEIGGDDVKGLSEEDIRDIEKIAEDIYEKQALERINKYLEL